MTAAIAPKAPAGYARISDDDRGDAQGVTRQEVDIQAECDRRGWPEAVMYVDNDRSASRFAHKARPEWNRLLADLAAGDVDALVVWKVDRSTRLGLVGAGRLLEALNVHGAPLVSCTEPIDTSAPMGMGELTLGILASVARQESENISMRVKRKNVDMAAAGRAHGGGVRPYGYEEDRVTLVPAEAKVLREAARRVLAGEQPGPVAGDFNRRGIPTAKGSKWTGTTLRRQLVSARIAGLRDHLGVRAAKGEWKAIITVPEHRRLRALLGGPHVPSLATRPPTARTYLLSGLIVCGDCGARMTAHPASGVRRYYCLTNRGGCNRVGIGAEPTEELIIQAVMQRLDKARLPRKPTDSTERAIAAEVEAIEVRMADLADAFAAGEISRPEWIRARQGLETRLASARQQERQTVRDRSADPWVGGKLRRGWPRMTLDQRRAVIGALVDQVTIAPTTRAAGRFDPQRIDVSWRA